MIIWVETTAFVANKPLAEYMGRVLGSLLLTFDKIMWGLHTLSGSPHDVLTGHHSSEFAPPPQPLHCAAVMRTSLF